MRPTVALVIYYVILALGYVWAIVQLFSAEPFDAWVLFTVTFAFQTYRNTVVKEMSDHA